MWKSGGRITKHRFDGKSQQHFNKCVVYQIITPQVRYQ